MYEDVRTGPHHVFRIQLTLSHQGADHAHHSTTVLTMLKYVPAALGGESYIDRVWEIHSNVDLIILVVL